MLSGPAHNRVFAEVVDEPVPSNPRALARYAAQGISSSLRSVASVRGVAQLVGSCLGVQRWAPSYDRDKFLADVMAAAIVSVVLIPQGMAYAVLAGLDPIYGLYSSTVPLLVYALFTTSSQVAVGPVAPTAILMESVIRGLTDAPPRSAEFTRLHVALALLSGCVQLAMSLLRFGWVASMLSWPVMSGFSSAAGVIIIISQLPDLLRLSTARESTFAGRVVQVFKNLHTVHVPTALLGIVCVLVLLYAKEVKIGSYRLPKKTPVPLVVVALAVFFSAVLRLDTYGIKVVGDIPSELPTPSVPVIRLEDVRALMPAAVILGFVNYVQTMTLSVMFGKKKGEAVSPGHELLALGASSVVGSFFHCHTVAGSFTRTALQSEAGAETPMTTALTGVFLSVCILTLTRVFRYLPVAVLAAIVFASAKPLISVADVRVLWKGRKSDLVQLLATIVAVLVLDLSNGLLVGVSVSLISLLYRSFRPRLTELGRLPGTDVFVALERYPDTRRIPGVVVLRLDGELHFGNVSDISCRLTSILLKEKTRVTDPAVTTDSSPPVDVECVATSNVVVPTAARASPTNGVIGPENGAPTVTTPRVTGTGSPHIFGERLERLGTPTGAVGRGLVRSTSRTGSGMFKPAQEENDERVLIHEETPELTLSEQPAVPRMSSRASSVQTAPVAGLVQRASAAVANGNGAASEETGGRRTRFVYALATVPEDAPTNGARVGNAARSAQAILTDGGDAVAVASVTSAVARSLSRHIGLDVMADRAPDSPGVTSAPADMLRSDRCLEENRAAVREPLRAVILDASRVVDIDATACRELQSIMEAYSKTTLPGNRRVLLLFAGLPGPVRDTLDRFGVNRATDPACTRFLTVAAAIAALLERQVENDWDHITQDLSTLAAKREGRVPQATRPEPTMAQRTVNPSPSRGAAPVALPAPVV